MKLEILKEHLEQAVGVTSKVSNKNLSLPVLGCVVLKAEKERVVVRATNLDVSVEFVLKAKVLEEGTVAVPAGVFSQAVSTATDQKLIISFNENTLKIKGSHGVANIKTVDVSDFPTLPYVKEGEGVSYTLPSKDVVRALKSVAFASSTSGMRPELSSVFMIVSGGVLTTAATDSFRLAESKINIKIKNDSDPILIPTRNVGDIVRVCSESETVEVRQGENQITFISGGSYITSRTIDGVFPEYDAIIPKNFTTTATTLTEDALRAFRKVSVFVDMSNQVGLGVDLGNKKFSIQSSNTSVGETVEEIEAALDGEDVFINFNARYVLDALTTISSDSVVFKIAGVGKPMVLSGVPDGGFTYLVMPMNK